LLIVIFERAVTRGRETKNVLLREYDIFMNVKKTLILAKISLYYSLNDSLFEFR